MTRPLLTAVAPRWEAELAGALARSRQVHVVRRCADVAELLGVAAAGLGSVAVVSSDLRGLERSVIDSLREHDVLVLGVHPPDDEPAGRLLRRWGIGTVVEADASPAGLDEALADLIAGEDSSQAAAPASSGSRTVAPHGAQEHHASEADELRVSGPQGDAPAAEAVVRKGHADDGPGAIGAGVDELEAVEPEDEHQLPPDPRQDPEDDPGTAPERGRIIVVWGPHGSPGRTTVAVNVAAELGDPLAPALLVDADTYGASVGQLLAILDEVPGIAAAARLADQGTLDRASLTDLAPEVRPGLRVLTGLPRADRWPELRDSALADVLEACRELAAWTVVDISGVLEEDEELSFDTLAPRRNGAAITALSAADHVVVVGAGDPVGLQRLVRGLDAVGEHAMAPRTVVVTRVRTGPVGRDPGRRILEALDRFAGVGQVHLVPDDQDAVDAALLHGRALVEVRPKSPARVALAGLADRLAEREPVSRRPRGRGIGRGLLRRGSR